MQKHIVRQSDIRGIVGVDFQIEDVGLLTQAFLMWLKNSVTVQRVVVGMDGRNESAAMYQQVSQAIVDAGYQVYFVGVCPLPIFNHALYHLSAQAGIMITGSGAEYGYNGLKFYQNTTVVEGLDLHQIYQMAQSPSACADAVAGKIIPCPIVEQYLDRLLQEFDYLSQYNFSLVIDASNGTAGPILSRLVKKMGWHNVEILHSDVDGYFPMHQPEPYKPENIEFMQQIQKRYPGSIAVCFDGDGDRLVFLDEKGVVISAERIIALLARSIFLKISHRAVVHDIQDSQWLDWMLYQIHAKSVVARHKVHVISSVIRQEHPVLVGQTHGRYLLFDRHQGYPDGVYVLLRILEILVQNRSTLHDLVVQLPRHLVKKPSDFVSSEYN